jgi:hypothetical protein
MKVPAVLVALHTVGRPLRAPAMLIAAAALPMAAVLATLSVTGASSPRYFPEPPREPEVSPWIVARAEGASPRACQLAALVVDADGPRAGAVLRLTRVTADGTAERWTAVSNQSGVHRFIDLPAGSYQLTAVVDEHAPAAAPPWRCGGDAERAFFTLPLQRSEHVFSGRVVSKDGKPAPGAELAIAQEADEKSALVGTARIPVSPDGTFSLRVAPGRYVLLAQAPHHAPLVRKLSFDDGAPSSTGRFVLSPAPRVTGRVIDEAGAPVAGAIVAAGGIFDPKVRVPSARTEADGTFSLPVVDGQDVVLTARGNGLVARSALGIVRSRLGFTDVDLVARAGRTVEGIVMHEDGSAWAFGAVRYRVRELGLTGVEKADGEGRFVLAGMPLDAEVEVWAEGNATGAWGAQVASPGRDQLALTYTPPAYHSGDPLR